MARRSPRRRRLFWTGVLIVTAGLAYGAKRRVDRLEADALSLAKSGQETIRLLKAYAAGVKERDLAQVMDCYDDAYRNPREAAWKERLVSERDGVRTYHWQITGRQAAAKSDVATRLAAFVGGLEEVEQSRYKLGRVEAHAGGGAVAHAVLWLRGRRGGQLVETHARFRLELARGDGGLKIHSQELLHGETVLGSGRGFADVAREAGLDFVARHNPQFRTPEWEPKRFGIVPYGAAGVSAADYDGDGWYDLFFADGARARLYRNNGDGTFSDTTARAGLPDALGGVNVAIFADLDNDGDEDLFVGSITGANRLFRNEGDGRFTDVTEGAGLGGLFVTTAAAGDYDGDGRLDLYVGRYLDPRVDLPTTLFYTRNGQGNSLLRNLGHLRFTDVTATAGVREGGLTLGVAWADYDGDGHQDLYVANDFGRNALLRNRGDGTFADVSKASGAYDIAYGMSASFGDVNNDGRLDLYVSNVHSGQRWYGQAATLYQYLITSVKQRTIFQDAPLYWEIYKLAGADWRGVGDSVVKGNTLLLGDGRGAFREVAEAAGANPFGWYWGSTFLDYDNDGRLDIFAANGWISGKTYDDL